MPIAGDACGGTPPYFAHAGATVEPGARIGAGTSVWHHAHVRTGAVIGAACTLGQNAFVDKDVRVGDRVKIENNASVHAGVTLGDDVFVGPGVVFTMTALRDPSRRTGRRRPRASVAARRSAPTPP